MLALALPATHGAGRPAQVILLASSSSALILDLGNIFGSLGLRVERVTDCQTAMAAIHALDLKEMRSILLLDTRMPRVANGQLLAEIVECGLRMRCAIALIADQVSDEWIARLREGVIDDIVPRSSGAAEWKTHVTTMQRGHQLYCELEQMREVAMLELRHDPVTGVLNRDTMLSILFRETDRVQRMGGALTVMILDVDDFGHWTGELGHEAGDALMRELAGRLGRTLRSYDLLGRCGKDQFMLALPGCGTVDAVAMAERLRMEVFEYPFDVNQDGDETRQIRLTACFGIASSRGRSPLVVVREAELTLERAKMQGPDAIRCASERAFAEEGLAEAGLARLFPAAGVVA